MRKPKKNHGKFDVHVYLEEPDSEILQERAKKENRSPANLIKHIVAHYCRPQDFAEQND